MDVSGTMQVITTYAIAIGFKIVGAIIFWLIGRWLIAFAIRMVTSSLERQKVDPTLLRVLAVRPYCHTDHYWQVYFDTNKIIRETFGAAGYPVPEQHFVVRNPS